MQRPAQRDELDQREKRAGRLGRVLVCAAAVPVLLVVAGCSSGSGSKDSGGKGSGSGGGTSSSAGASASPTVRAAAYRTIPDSCGVLSQKTLTSLVPKAAKSGKKGSSDEAGKRASCSWSSLDNNGVKGSQFRWLNVSLLRFDSDAARGEGDQLAHVYYEKQVKDAQSVAGAQNSRSQAVSGTGDEATAVRYDLKKKEGSFKQQTVVARVQNVVVTLDYNGAGLAGDSTPSADDLSSLAQQAAKEAVASVAAANGGQGAGSGGGSGSGTAKPSPSGSASPSASASKAGKASASPSSSPSSSASKKS